MNKRNRQASVYNNLDRFVRLRQAALIAELDRDVQLKEVHKEIGDYCGVNGETIALIKSRNYNPSLVVALKLSDYFKVTVNDLFSLKEVE